MRIEIFFKIRESCLKIYFPQIFAPNIYDKSTPTPIHLHSTPCSAHQSEALPVRETQRDESSFVCEGMVKSFIFSRDELLFGEWVTEVPCRPLGTALRRTQLALRAPLRRFRPACPVSSCHRRCCRLRLTRGHRTRAGTGSSWICPCTPWPADRRGHSSRRSRTRRRWKRGWRSWRSWRRGMTPLACSEGDRWRHGSCDRR